MCRNGNSKRKAGERCYGRASINTTTDLLRVTKPHNHDAEEEFYETKNLERNMKNHVKPGNSSLTGGMKNSVFHKCSREASEAARKNVTWAKMYGTLYKVKRQYQPKNPKCVGDYAEGLRAHPDTFGKNFLDYYEVDGEPAGILFGNKELIEWLIQFLKEAGWDGTFRIVPRLFYQVFTIHIIFEGRSWPLIVALMTRKLRTHYDALFSKVNEIIPQFKPERGMADAEAAPRSSAKHYYDDLVVNICWFHYCQAIIQNIKKRGFMHLFKTSKMFGKWVRRIMAVPLLPHHMMNEVFEELLQQTFLFHRR